mgnify:CR=1 FL=1
MDEGESDTEEEKKAREDAKQLLTEFEGDVWKVCATRTRRDAL